jgi:RecA/RadA recombinase
MRLNKTVSEYAEEIKSAICETNSGKSNNTKIEIPTKFQKIVSTGSTLLDLEISGARTREGGIPPGLIVELVGLYSTGKSALAMEIAGNAQRKGGDVLVLDPEGRIDQDYATVYGMHISHENYERPNTVSEVFSKIYRWQPKPKNEDSINCVVIDSLAALSTDLELESEEGDKRGQRRAKEFSEGLRKTARVIANNKWLVVCTNQLRDAETGMIITGGKGLVYYPSLIIQLSRSNKWQIEKSVQFQGHEVSRVIGVRSVAKIIKSSIADPLGECDIYIVFGVGIDDVRANLQWYKDQLKLTKYDAVTKEFQSLERAILHVEENNLEAELRNKVIDLWHEIYEKFKVSRKPKVRF